MTRRKQRHRMKRAVLDVADIKRIRATAKAHSSLAHALIEWLYTNGARASEAGLARLTDVDMHNGTVLLTHLKGGLPPEPQPMAKALVAALRGWLPKREFATHAQQDYVFPSANPLPCYPCKGTKWVSAKSRRRGEGAKVVSCPHCHGAGVRLGMTRHEVRHLVVEVFTLAGIPKQFHFPHVLRHSAVTHMLDTGTPPTAIQERVGHKALETTFGYMHTTKEARARVNKAFDEDDDEDDDT